MSALGASTQFFPRAGARGSTPMKPPDRRTDEELLESYRRGEAGVFPLLIRRHQDDLLRFLLRLTGDRAAAEDVFQEAFLQVHLSAHTFDSARRFKPWLFTIAANKARDMLRRSNRRRTLDLHASVGGAAGSGDGDARTFVDFLEVDIPTPSEGVDAAEQDRRVQQAIDSMPGSLREILLLAYFQRMSYTDIAESLAIPLGTVKSRLHAAVATFAKRWNAFNPGEAGSARKATESGERDG